MGTRLPTDRWGTPGPATSRASMLAEHVAYGATVKRIASLMLVSVGIGLFVFYLVILTLDPRSTHMRGADYWIYHDATLRLLDGGPWYLPEQTTGQPYTVIVGHVMYPPVAVPFLVPLTLLPVAVWWIVPALIVAGVVVYWRPSPWGWVGIAACLAYPSTSELWVSANPGMWIVAACALGTIWRPAFAFILLKPAVFPFALLGIRSRGWWVIVATWSVVSLLVLPWTLEWLGVVLNARGFFSGFLYGYRDVGMMCIPLIAWAARSRWSGRQGSDRHIGRPEYRS